MAKSPHKYKTYNMTEQTIPASYEAAYEELENIAVAIENDELSIDLLSEKVARAAYLVQFCQDKLRKADEDVKKIMDQMKNIQG
jgi:exodeoxyribonuclease VII small subunit